MLPNDIISKQEQDIIWFINHSAPALGIKSSFSSFIRSLWSPGKVPATDNAVVALCDDPKRPIARNRKIYNIIASLPLHDRARLYRVYDYEAQHLYSPAIRIVFADLAGLVPDNDIIIDKLCRNQVAHCLSPSDRELLASIKKQVRAEYLKLHENYYIVSRQIQKSNSTL